MSLCFKNKLNISLSYTTSDSCLDILDDEVVRPGTEAIAPSLHIHFLCTTSRHHDNQRIRLVNIREAGFAQTRERIDICRDSFYALNYAISGTSVPMTSTSGSRRTH
jgi:hypothetical protein